MANSRYRKQGLVDAGRFWDGTEVDWVCAGWTDCEPRVGSEAYGYPDTKNRN